jgi:hypothetical protein
MSSTTTHMRVNKKILEDLNELAKSKDMTMQAVLRMMIRKEKELK